MATSSITKLKRGGIKILKPAGRKAGMLRLRAPESIDTQKLPDGGYNYTHRRRFKNASELLSRWDDTKRMRGSMNSFLNILRSYERYPYKDKQGNIKPSFGQLRFRIDRALQTYIDFVTERQRWARIETMEGLEESQSKTWSDQISFAFQRFCIKTWGKGFHDMLLGIKDMLLYSKGTHIWVSSHGVYPENIPFETVWPDGNAGQLPETFDMMFIERRYTAVELFDMINEPQSTEDGWKREPVLRVIRNLSAGFRDDSLSRTFERYRTNEVTADEMDLTVDCVEAYVKEYHPDENGDRITKYIVPKGAAIPKANPSTGLTNDDINNVGLFLEKPSFAKCFSEVLGVLAHQVTREYYESPSYAQQIYTVCKTYDIVNNRILEAVEDNMRVFLTTDSPDVQSKLQKARMGQFNVLDADVTIEQQRIQRPVMEGAGVMRGLMIDQDAGTGTHVPHETQRGKTPKSATQSEYDEQMQSSMKSAELKLFNSFMTLIMNEMYRRWVNEMRPDDEGYENFERFKKYLRKKNVPSSAWKHENVTVESVLNLGAASPVARIRGGRIILETLATPARTPGERQAKRDIIAGTFGVENIEVYLPGEDDVAVPEDSLIGLENDALSDSSGDPSWVLVNPDHLHMRHIPLHLGAMMSLVDKSAQLLQNIQQFPAQDEGVILNTITDILIGVDNIGSHTLAHMAVASRGKEPVRQAQLGQFKAKLASIQQSQDKIEKALDGRQQERLQQSREAGMEDPETAHKRKMFAMQEEHEARMMALKYTDSQMKGEQLRSQSAQNSELKNMLDVRHAEFKKEIEIIQAQIDNIKKSGRANEGSNGSSRQKART